MLNTSTREPLLSGFTGAAVYNLFDEQAREFVWSRLNATYASYGIKVWWQDCDEWCNFRGAAPSSFSHPGGALYPGSGVDEAVAARYPDMIARMFSDGMKRSGISDGIQLGRSAWAGTQRYGHAVWSGDTSSVWADLAMSVPAAQNIGLSGIPWWTTGKCDCVCGYSLPLA